MKRFKKLFCFILSVCVFCGLTSAIGKTRIANATGKLYVNLNVGQNIAVIIKAEIPDATTASATFSFIGNDQAGNANETAYIDTVSGEKEEGGNEWKFTYKGVAPQYMGKEISVKVDYKNADSDTLITFAQEKISVKGVIANYLSSTAAELKISENAFEKLKVLCYDILNYGAAAQKYANVDKNALVNVGYEESGSKTDFTALTDTIANDGEVKLLQGVKFDYNLQPTVKFTTTYSDLSATVNGAPAAIEESDGAYKITFADYDVLTLYEPYTFVVKSGENVIASSSSTLGALAKKYNIEIVRAAYTYGESVRKYAKAFMNFTTQVFEAENCAYYIEAKGEHAADDKYTDFETLAPFNYYDGDTACDNYIANGAGGNASVRNIQGNQEGKNVYFKFTVNTAESGYYKIKTRAVCNNTEKISRMFSVNVNNEKNSDGSLKLVTDKKEQQVYCGNRLSEYADLGGKEYVSYCSRAWWSIIDVGTVFLSKGDNEIRIYMPGGFGGNIDCFEVIDSEEQKTTKIISYNNEKLERVDVSETGTVLYLENGKKFSDHVNVKDLDYRHPVRYTLLYMSLTNNTEIPILESMLEGKVDYNKVGEEQVVTVTDPVSGESASFKLFIKA